MDGRQVDHGDNLAMVDLLFFLVPFFALVFMGWGATRGGLLPVQGIPALNAFVLYFGLSALVFQLTASGALFHGHWSSMLLAYGLAGSIVLMLAMAWAHRQGLVPLNAGLLGLVTVYPNTGFLGLPLLTGLLGPQAAGPVAATMLIDVLLFSSVCLAWAHRRPGAALQLGPPIKGAARNPLLWAMAAGMVVAQSGWALPKPMADTVRLLSQAATPTALFTLGAMLARSGMQHTQAGTRLSVWPLVLLKLVLHPALVWLAAQGLRMAGQEVPQAGLVTLMLAAALPSAANVSMLAEREGADAGLVARVIMWTTALALLGLTAWAQMLGVHGS